MLLENSQWIDMPCTPAKRWLPRKAKPKKGLSGFANAGKVTRNEKFRAGFSDYIMLCARSAPMSPINRIMRTTKNTSSTSVYVDILIFSIAIATKNKIQNFSTWKAVPSCCSDDWSRFRWQLFVTVYKMFCSPREQRCEARDKFISPSNNMNTGDESGERRVNWDQLINWNWLRQ